MPFAERPPVDCTPPAQARGMVNTTADQGADNIKITVPEDIQRAEHILATMEQQR